MLFKCGLTKAPQRRPWDRTALSAVTRLPLPLVPPTRIAGTARCGLPARSRRRARRSRPGSMRPCPREYSRRRACSYSGRGRTFSALEQSVRLIKVNEVKLAPEDAQIANAGELRARDADPLRGPVCAVKDREVPLVGVLAIEQCNWQAVVVDERGFAASGQRVERDLLCAPRIHVVTVDEQLLCCRGIGCREQVGAGAQDAV